MSAVAEVPTTTADVPQWQLALDRGNATRMARASWKRQLAMRPDIVAARERAAEVLEDVPDVLLGMSVEDLLGACRGFGEQTVRRVCDAAAVDSRELLGALGDSHRDRLIGALRMHSGRERLAG